MFPISQFQYAITNALHIYSSPAKFLASLHAAEPISHYCSSGQHSYTHGPLTDTNAVTSGSPCFKYHAEDHSNTLRHCLVTHLNTSLEQPS